MVMLKQMSKTRRNLYFYPLCTNTDESPVQPNLNMGLHTIAIAGVLFNKG